MQKELISFHGNKRVKDFYLSRVKAHADLDEIIQGVYWQRGKGCAVGCTIHSGVHADYEPKLGIPRCIAELEDQIFEGLPSEDAKYFPVQFLTAIPIGKDLGPVWKKFLIWLLVDEKTGVIRHSKTKKGKKAIYDVAMILLKSITHKVSKEQFKTVQKAALANASANAIAAAATNACDRFAAATAESAAEAAAADVPAAATAVRAAADAEAYAAAYTTSNQYAADEARIKRYQSMRDKLIELLSEA